MPDSSQSSPPPPQVPRGEAIRPVDLRTIDQRFERYRLVQSTSRRPGGQSERRSVRDSPAAQRSASRLRHFSVHRACNLYRCFRCGSAGNALDLWSAFRQLPCTQRSWNSWPTSTILSLAPTTPRIRQPRNTDSPTGKSATEFQPSLQEWPRASSQSTKIASCRPSSIAGCDIADGAVQAKRIVFERGRSAASSLPDDMCRLVTLPGISTTLEPTRPRRFCQWFFTVALPKPR